MADKSLRSAASLEEEEGKPMKYIRYQRKSRAMCDQEDTNRMITHVSIDDQQLLNKELQGEPIKAKSAVARDDDSITNQILDGETMASLTLMGKYVHRNKRTPKKMIIFSHIYSPPINTMEGVVKVSEEEEVICSVNNEKQGSRTEQLSEDEELQNTEKKVKEEKQSSLPASSPEAEEMREPLLRLFSKHLTADDAKRHLQITRDQLDHFLFSLVVTAELFEPGRRVILKIVNKHGENQKMMLISYRDVDETIKHCITYGWKEFVNAHNLEAGDEIIFYRYPTSKDDKELIIEFIKAMAF